MGPRAEWAIDSEPIYSMGAAFRKVRYKVARDNCKFPRAALGIECFDFNHNYNKIVRSDWLSTALISAFITSTLKSLAIRAI